MHLTSLACASRFELSPDAFGLSVACRSGMTCSTGSAATPSKRRCLLRSLDFMKVVIFIFAKARHVAIATGAMNSFSRRSRESANYKPHQGIYAAWGSGNFGDRTSVVLYCGQFL